MGKKSFFSILFIIAGLAVAGYISYFAFKENRRNRQIESEINILRQEAEKLRQNNNAKKEKITYFDTPEFQEKIAKEKLNLQKENESVAVIKPSQVVRTQGSGKEETTVNQSQQEPVKPNYAKWWDYFFKY